MKIKALSFRQPWADLVVQGRKTLDLRTWNTLFRGTIAIYASQTIEKEACERFGIDPDRLTTGAVIGIVDLTGVSKLDEATYYAREHQHLGGRNFHDTLFGWEFANPLPLRDPIPTRGRLLLFDVEIPDQTTPPDQFSDSTIVDPSIELGHEIEDRNSDSSPFELRLIPETDPKTSAISYRLAVYQRHVQSPGPQPTLYNNHTFQISRLVEIGGIALQSISDQILETLRDNGYKATDLNPNRREPFALKEESGVRLALIFMAARLITKVTRIEGISHGIRSMTVEELYYWFAKCTSTTSAERAQRALRILLADE